MTDEQTCRCRDFCAEDTEETGRPCRREQKRQKQAAKDVERATQLTNRKEVT